MEWVASHSLLEKQNKKLKKVVNIMEEIKVTLGTGTSL